MHPILTDSRHLAAYMVASLPLAVLAAAVFTQGPSGLPATSAALVAVPLAIAAVGLVLPVWYLCRALPINATPVTRLVITHAGGAVVTGLALVYGGSILSRIVAAYGGDPRLPELYQAHVPAVMAGGLLVYLLAVSTNSVLLAVDATRRAEQRSIELAMLAREAELKALRAQVHPHFLFNSLNSISSLVTTDPARAREMCILLAEFFRKTLAVGEKPTVSLDEELAVARTYLAIEGLRLGPRLNVEEVVDEAARACRLPPLLLQPLVENAIRHGIATRPEGGVLRIEARTDGQRVRISVENPFDPDAPARPGVGVGLANVRRRLLAGYGERALVDAQRFEDRFRVAVSMPAEVAE